MFTVIAMYPNLFRHLRTAVQFPSRNVHTSPLIFGAKLLDGVKLAKEVRLKLKSEVENWVQSGHRPPKLVALFVGNDSASTIYVRNKLRAANEIGIDSVKLNLPASISQSELIKEIQILNDDPEVDGILVQLPVPNHISEQEVCNSVTPAKDVDGFNFINVGRLCLNIESFVPCTALAVHELLKAYGIPTFGKNAVVCGRSKNVGMPIAMLLHTDSNKCKGEVYAMDATTTICHRNTPRDCLKEFTKNADIIVSATGISNLITADMVKEGACVIDVGIHRIVDPSTGRKSIVGDVDFQNVSQVAGYITPCPGGVGPMTVAMLMKNTVTASRKSIDFGSTMLK